MTAADQPTTEPSVRGWVVVDKKTGALDWDGKLHPTHDDAYLGLRAYGDTVEAVRERRTFYDVLPVLDALPAPQPAADTERPVGFTPRGFGIWSEFTDRYGQKVTVFDSSIATESSVWVAPADKENIHLDEAQAIELRDALSAWLISLDKELEEA